MNDILLAIIGSITTILTAIFSVVYSKRNTRNIEILIPVENKRKFEETRKHDFWKLMTIVALFVGIILTISIIAIKRKIALKNEVEKVNYKIESMIEKGLAKSNGSPYILPTILMNINLEMVKDSSGSHLESDICMVYNTIYLEKISQPSRAFWDSWRANRGAELIKLNGSDKQILIGDAITSKSWHAFYPTDIGENRITVSHLKQIYSPNLKDYESKFFGRLGNNQEEFAYPNTDDDEIGELVIMVSSSTLNLKLEELHNAATGSINDLKVSEWIEPVLLTTTDKGKVYTTVIARFKDLKNNEVAKLKVNW